MPHELPVFHYVSKRLLMATTKRGADFFQYLSFTYGSPMYNRRLQIVIEVSRIAWNSFNLQDFSWIHAGFGLDLAHSWKDWLTTYNSGYYVIPKLSPI